MPSSAWSTSPNHRAHGTDEVDELDEDGNTIRRGVQGPDFPTAGRILGRKGILEAYYHRSRTRDCAWQLAC